MIRPIHFVVPRLFADRLATLPREVLGSTYPYWVGGQYNWAAQSYLVLRELREGLSIGTEPKPGMINFAHSMTWRALGPRRGEFRVGVRADYPRLFDIDFEILQNPAMRCGVRQAYLPYWPVPGLIPRDPARKGVETIAYAGRLGPRNLAAALRETGGRGADLAVATIAPDRWHDLSAIDLLVAIRRFGREPHLSKPPSKLINAWLADIPLIAGHDSAFAAIGRPGEDYIRVENEAGLREAVTRLREDAAHYAAVVEKGRARAAAFTHAAIARQWLAMFEHRIGPLYDDWNAAGGPSRRPVLPALLDRGRDAVSSLKAGASKRPAGRRLTSPSSPR